MGLFKWFFDNVRSSLEVEREGSGSGSHQTKQKPEEETFWQGVSGLFKKKPKKLKCGACGHVQRRGDWEKAMNVRVKAMGSRGFINFGVPPHCLSCDSTDLRDPSKC